jgi:hypothetical protein
MTDMPKRFTPEQVLAVFADPTAKPMSTVQVAMACRAAATGRPGGWRPDVQGNADVLKALKVLVDDGRLITSRAKTYGKPWDPADEKNRHLLDGVDAVSRFYATPEQSEAWRAKIETHKQRVAAADVLAERLEKTEAVRRVNVHQGRDYSDALISLSLTIEQAARIVDLLEADGAAGE